jgi:hypothetical protein
MMKRWLLGAYLGAVAMACSASDGEPSGSVTGRWCGREVSTAEQCTGDEVEYLELVQDGSQVTGQICEAYGKDCAPIEEGKLSGSRLTFGFDPVNVGGLATLELSGDVLQGTLHSDKCACELPFTFHRL